MMRELILAISLAGGPGTPGVGWYLLRMVRRSREIPPRNHQALESADGEVHEITDETNHDDARDDNRGLQLCARLLN